MKLKKGNISVIDIGKMRDIVTLMQPTITTDGRGGSDDITFTETDVFTFFVPGKNLRQLQESGLTFDKMGTFYIRYDASVVDNWKLRFRGDEYSIQGVENVEAANRFTQIVAYTKA